MSDEIEKRVAEMEEQMKQLKENQSKDQISIIAYSGDLDKMIAALIIATGARAMDTEVKMFFTFWATALLRDKKKKARGKDFMSKMFGVMLPKGTTQFKLSRMNMCGMGTTMLRGLMKKKGVPSIEELLATAGEMGVEINVCQMSMNLMGFTREEMIDYPLMNYVGVGSYLADANESRIQLFI